MDHMGGDFIRGNAHADKTGKDQASNPDASLTPSERGRSRRKVDIAQLSQV